MLKELAKNENPHFRGEPMIVEKGPATRFDAWAFERGYTAVVNFRDSRGSRHAMYGFHKPTMQWHCWAN